MSIDIRRTVEVTSATEAGAEKVARRTHGLFKHLKGTVTNKYIVWLDDMGVEHIAGCHAQHCRHFDCNTGDAPIREYCTQCDPDCY